MLHGSLVQNLVIVPVSLIITIRLVQPSSATAE